MPQEKFTAHKYANVGTQEPFTAAFLGLTDTNESDANGVQDYVRVESRIVTLVEPMEGKGEPSKLQPLNVAFDQENKAVNELQNLKASHVCDAY